MKKKIALLVAGPVLACSNPLLANVWTAAEGDFRVGGNWNGGVPGPGDFADIFNGGTAVIDAGLLLDVGALAIGGDGSGFANEIGNLRIEGGVTQFSSSIDSHSYVGNTAQDFATAGESSLIMNGGEIQIDDPAGAVSGQSGFSSRFDFDGSGSNTWETAGLNNKDLKVGIKTLGRLELHGASKLFLGDDLGFANDSGGVGQEAVLVMDGTSMIGIGSGSEVGKTNAVVNMTLSDSAIIAIGNSMGPGAATGQTDEGYFTVGTRDSGNQTISIADQAEIQCMTLQNRLGNTTISLSGEGKLKIYNVLEGSGTILATRPSYLAANAPCSTTVSLRGSSVMLVDCLLGNTESMGSNGVNGLHVSGGQSLESATADNVGSYNSSPGGVAVLDLGESALLDIRQSLHLGFGRAESSNATLRIEGPDATVTIGDNLNLAFNEYVENLSPGEGNRPGTGTLDFVITGSMQKPISVGGIARVMNGTLKITLKDYVPPVGTSYTLIQAASVDGEFKSIDLSEAVLAGSSSWKIESTPTSLVATVIPSSQPSLMIETLEGEAVLTWPGEGQLQFSEDLLTPFVDVEGARSPYSTPLDEPKKFFRLIY